MIIIVAGPSGCGKSTVIRGKSTHIIHVDHDTTARNILAKKVAEAEKQGIVLVDCPFAVSVLSDEIIAAGGSKPVLWYIVESEVTVAARIRERKGYVPKRSTVAHMNKRAIEQSDFYGTADRVLEKVKSL